MTSQAHIPVMLQEVITALQPVRGKVIIDATFGAGGYSAALLEAGAKVVAIDRDPDAYQAGQKLVDLWKGQLDLHLGRFSALDKFASASGFSRVDGVVADIGVSSMQIDQAERGFSFQADGPLDMRMEQAGPSAADVVNQMAQGDLTRLIGLLGDERQASRISSAICTRRKEQEFSTTRELASLVENTMPRKQGDRIHPATRTFQALRMFVNRELDELADALIAAEKTLQPGGVLTLVTFHSLEDRLVKKFLRDRAEAPSTSRHLPLTEASTPTFEYQKRNAISASSDEAERNPRARSAKLRSAVRTEAPARPIERKIFGLPRLADLPGVASSMGNSR